MKDLWRHAREKPTNPYSTSNQKKHSVMVSINATVIRGILLVIQPCAARSIVRLFTGTLLFLRGHVRSGVRDPLTQRGRAGPWNTRVDNIFRVYSEGGRGQFSRGGVALIAVVHREFASVPSSSLTPVHTATSSTRLLSSRSPPSHRSRPFSSVRGHSPPESLRSAPREARGSARCYTLGSNLRTAGATQTNARCARREGVRRIFVFAHSRANAHPSSCGGIFRREENCPLSCFIKMRAAFFSQDSLDIVLILIGTSLLLIIILLGLNDILHKTGSFVFDVALKISKKG